MKKLLYMLCLLVFAACSDDDDKNEVMSDFDKPFTSISNSELKGMLQDFWLIDTIIDDYEEGHRLDVIRPIHKALEQYNVDINFNNNIIRKIHHYMIQRFKKGLCISGREITSSDTSCKKCIS